MSLAGKIIHQTYPNLSHLLMVQLEDNTLKLILDILCKIYRGEVWMCSDFLVIFQKRFIHHYIFCLSFSHWKFFSLNDVGGSL